MNTSGYGQEFSLVSECAPLAIAVAALQVFRDRLPGARITLTVLLLIQIGVGAVAGTKGELRLRSTRGGYPVQRADRRRLPKAPLIVLVTFFFAVVVPFNLAYRHAVTDNGRLTPSEAIAAAPEILRQAVGVQSLSSIVPDSIDFLEQRLQEIDNPAIVLQRTPTQIAFRNPIELIEAPIAQWVPRKFWSGKPVYLTGLQFTQEFYELPPNSGSADTMVGGLYWYGGLIPLIVGMFLLAGCGGAAGR